MDSGGGRDPNLQPSVAGNDDGGGYSKRKVPEDPVEVAKQRAQEIASRIMNDFESKRPRTESLPPAAPQVSTITANPSYQTPQFPVSYAAQTSQFNTLQGASKKISIPNGKVGIIIGRGGDQIKNLQLKSGARIQITRDADADPTSMTRDVELVGTPEQIIRAEELINEVIADAEAANSASSGNRVAGAVQPGAEQFVMKVPNDKVSLIIGKGGETIKSMQAKSGARIQVVPLHPPPNDTSTERSIYISGTEEQIDSAKELINEVISGNRLRGSSGSTGYAQSVYPTNAAWTPPPAVQQQQQQQQQQSAYGYTQQGAYPMPPHPYGYSISTYPPPPQQAGWDQTNPSSAVPTPQQNNASYNIYGQQAQPAATSNYSQFPSTTSYSYSQGYTQTFGQEYSGGQVPATDQQKAPAYANSAYGTPVTSSQPDSSSSSVETSQPGTGGGYGLLPPAPSSQADGTLPAPAYATGYNQPGTTAAPVNGYGAYPSYAAQPGGYDQAGYAQPGGYGQQQGVQISSQAAPQSYYGYPQPQAQPNYYQGMYPPSAGGGQQPVQQQPQTQSSSTSGVPQSAAYYGNEKTDDGNPANGTGVVAQESDNPKS
ncbi:hypothetical protein Dimus_002258 [Dionaea muscipula]